MNLNIITRFILETMWPSNDLQSTTLIVFNSWMSKIHSAFVNLPIINNCSNKDCAL